MNYYDSPFYKELAEANTCVFGGVASVFLDEECGIPPAEKAIMLNSTLATLFTLANELHKKHPERTIYEIAHDFGLPKSILNRAEKDGLAESLASCNGPASIEA